MKIIKVTYTVKPDFVPKNQENVKAFIEDLSKIDNSGLRYFAFLGGDGKTFNHFAIYEKDEAQKLLFDLPSFQFFQKERDGSGLEVSPQIEELTLVASSVNIFQNSTTWQNLL
jgi:hypothetical protein